MPSLTAALATQHDENRVAGSAVVRFWMAFIKLPSPAAGRLVLASRGGRPVRPRTGGGTSATFAIATSAVTTSTAVTITARAGDVTRSTTLTLTPAPQTATLTLNATGRSGERVTSTPAGINVRVGSSGSASFSVGTSITLRATDDRDVIWSGDCSSGGSKTKTCTFTLSGNATVTANVQ